MRDGVDYVPTNRALGPPLHLGGRRRAIVGPAIAVIWLGSGLRLVFGTIFFAGVHDFGALWASARSRGQSVGMLSGRLIGSRGRSLFLVVIFLVLLMVNGAFAAVISNLLVSTPTSVIPVWGAILVALVIGQMIYRYNMKLLWPSLGGVIVLYALILIGNQYPIVLPDEVMGLSAKSLWILLLFVYAAIASLLPVWVLLQPRVHQRPATVRRPRPALPGGAVRRAGSWWRRPSTRAAGRYPEHRAAAVRHHRLRRDLRLPRPGASGTTSKQLDKETDARFVGYFGAMGEGMLSLAAIICCTAGFATLTDWQQVYTAFGSGGVTAFVQGWRRAAGQRSGPACRAWRDHSRSDGDSLRRHHHGHRPAPAALRHPGSRGRNEGQHPGGHADRRRRGALAFGAGSDGTGGMVIWPLFGTTNQLLAGLTLAVITVILIKLGRSPVSHPGAAGVPAGHVDLRAAGADGPVLPRRKLLLGMDVIILIAALWVTLEAIIAMRKTRPSAPSSAAVSEPLSIRQGFRGAARVLRRALSANLRPRDGTTCSCCWCSAKPWACRTRPPGTLELMPALYERFHDWHRRMGMEHSPLDHIACC